MSWPLLLLAAAGLAVLLVLIAKLRGGGRGDLLGPPKRKPRHLPAEELDRLTELVGRGEEAEALRQLKSAGYSEKQSKRLLWLMARIAETDE
jgi:hypothetical protein